MMHENLGYVNPEPAFRAQRRPRNDDEGPEALVALTAEVRCC